MRALFITPLYPPNRSGSSIHVAALARALAWDGARVEVWTTNAWDTHYFVDRRLRKVPALAQWDQGVFVRRFPLSDRTLRRPGLLRALQRLKPPLTQWAFRDQATHSWHLWAHALASPTRAHLVVAGVLPHTAFLTAGFLVSRRWGAKLVFLPLIHLGEPLRVEYRHEFLSRGVPMLLAKADLVICNTEAEREILRARGLSPERLLVIGPGADPWSCLGGSAARFKRRFGIRGPVVLQLGTQTHEKGSHHTAEAVRALRARGIGVTGVFVGFAREDFSGAYLGGLPAEERQGLLVLGEVDDDTKRDALAAADVVVLPSRADSFGIAILEAWMACKPVIGALAGGIPTVIRDGVDGFLVPFGDWHAMAWLIELLLSKPHVAAALAQAGRARVWEQFTWPQVCARFLDAISPLVGGRPLL